MCGSIHHRSNSADTGSPGRLQGKRVLSRGGWWLYETLDFPVSVSTGSTCGRLPKLPSILHQASFLLLPTALLSANHRSELDLSPRFSQGGCFTCYSLSTLCLQIDNYLWHKASWFFFNSYMSDWHWLEQSNLTEWRQKRMKLENIFLCLPLPMISFLAEHKETMGAAPNPWSTHQLSIKYFKTLTPSDPNQDM